MRGAWLEAREETFARRLILLPLLPVSWIYAGIASFHRFATERG